MDKKKYKERKKVQLVNFIIDVLTPLKREPFDSLIIIREN